MLRCEGANKCKEENCPHSVPHKFNEACDFVCKILGVHTHCVEIKDEYNRGYEAAITDVIKFLQVLKHD